MQPGRSLLERARSGPVPLSVLAVVALFAALHGPALVEHLRFSTDHFHFADDARVLVYPLFRIEDPALFPGDPVVEYYLSSLPDGYRLFYEVFGRLFGVERVSKGLPYVLLGVSLACLLVLAKRLGGAAAAIGAVSLALGSPYLLGRMAGGLPRGFALPLLFAGALCLVTGRVRTLAALVLAGALFYPMAGVVLGVTLALWLLLPLPERGSASEWSLRVRAGFLVALAVVSGGALLPAAQRLAPYGSAITPELWGRFPEAGSAGRFDAADRAPFPPLPDALLAPLRAALVGVGQAFGPFATPEARPAWLVPALGLLAVAGVVLLARRHVEAQRMLLFAAGLVLCHTLSHLARLRMFLPERYVAYGVPVLALAAVPAALSVLTFAERRAWRLLPYVYVCVLLVLLGARGSAWTGITVSIPPSERALYGRIAELPRDALVAGWPGDAIDNVPYLSRRSVYLARETHMPFHVRFTELSRARAERLIAAYFAVSDAELRAFRDETGVTHLLVDRSHFASRPRYFAPFDELAARAFTTQERAGSAVLRSVARARVHESARFVLLELSRL